GGAGSSSAVSARATATRRASSATCPATERQRQAPRSKNGRSGASESPPSRSLAAPVVATPLPVPRGATRRGPAPVASAPYRGQPSQSSPPTSHRRRHGPARAAEAATPTSDPPATGGASLAERQPSRKSGEHHVQRPLESSLLDWAGREAAG